MKLAKVICAIAASVFTTNHLNAAINVTIGSFPASSGGSFVNRTWTPTSSPSRISLTDLMTQFQSGNVTVSTSGNLAEDGDISVTAQIDINAMPVGSTRTLVLQARDDISITAPINDSNPATAQNLQLFLNAALTDPTGAVTLGSNIATGAGNITVNCNNFIKSPQAAISTLGGDIDVAASGSINVANGQISTGGGNFRVAGASGSLFNANIATYGGGIMIELTESTNVEVASGTLDASGGSGDGTITINGFGGGITIASSVVLKSGNRGAVTLSAGSATEDIIQGGTLEAGSGGVTIRAQDSLQLNGVITSIGPIILRSDVESNGAGNITFNAPVTSTASRIDASGVELITSPAAILTTTAAGINGTLSLTGQEGVSIAGNLLAGGLLQLRADSNSNGVGAFSMTAPAISSVEGDIRIQGAGEVGSTVASDGGGITFLTMGSLTIKNIVSSKGGLITFSGSDTGTVTLTSTCSLNAAHSSGVGSVSLMKTNGSISTQSGSSILSGSLGSVEIRQQGSASNIVMLSALTAGSAGVTISSNNHVSVDGIISAAGSILLQANADDSNGGNLTISKAATSANSAITLKGVNVLISQTLTSSQKIIFEHTGEATVSSAVQGNVELKSGVTKPATNTLGNNGGLTLLSSAILEFPSAAETLAPRAFTQSAGTELRMKLRGSTAGTFNRIITGVVQFGGILTLLADPAYTFIPPASFDLFDFTSVSGTHAATNFPAISNTIGWNISALKTTGVVSVFYLPITSSGTPIIVDFPTGGTLNQPVISNGGNITIPATGPALSLNSQVLSNGGQITVTQTGPGGLTLGSTGILNASGGNGLGKVSLTNLDGDVTTEPGSLLKSGTGGGVSLLAKGLTASILSGGRIETGTIGTSLIADANIRITGEIISTGPVYIEADKDGNGTGVVTIAAPVTSTKDITIKGQEIFITHAVTTISPSKIILDPSQAATITGILTGDVELRGGLIKAGHGTLGNSGGITLISPAVLDFINPGDVLSPANYTQGAGSELIINIAGPALGQYNRIASTGPMLLGGKLTVRLVGNYVPAVGTIFDILDFSSISGDFTAISLPALRNGTMWDIRQLKVGGTLGVIVSPPAENQQILVTKNASSSITLKAGGFADIGFTVMSLPTSGTLSGTSPNLLYTPVLDFVGEDRFTYRTSSSTGNQALATISISVLPAITSFTNGTYYGIITGADFAHSGSFSFSVTSTGSVTGRLIYGDQTMAFTGKFDANGQMTVSIRRLYGLPPIMLILSRSIVNGIAVISGRVIDGESIAILEGGGPGSNGGSGTGGIVSAGRYTINIFPNPNETGPAFPQGIGYMVFSVSKTGLTNVVGRMPEGTLFTNSVSVQKDGSWPLHIRLYSGKGAFQTLARFLDGTIVRAVTSKWWKPSLQNWSVRPSKFHFSTALYPTGFYATPSIEGARYIRPTATNAMIQSAPNGSTQLRLLGGNLQSGTTMTVLINANRVLGLSQSLPNMNVKVDPVHGTCAGFFKHPVTGKTVPFVGALNQRLGKFYGAFQGDTEVGNWCMEVVNP